MNCVYCGITNNLNTTFQITLDDGQKIQVQICDEHAEDATVKSAKVAYLSKQKQIEEFLEQAKALGLNISINNSNNLSVASQPVQQRPQQQFNDIREDPNAFIVDTDALDRSASLIQTVGAAEFGVSDTIKFNSLSDKLDPNILKGKAKITMAEGRQGIPIPIPEQRIDGTGTTRISIKKSMDDGKLQNAFKKMAESSLRNSGPDFAKAGYRNSMHECTFCRGECTIRDNRGTVMCPKCQGSGIISSY